MVSIILPTYNSYKFIEQTLNSILNQTYHNWELLITDDYSTDLTWEIIKKYQCNDNRIKIFQLEKNSGAAVARNNSIKHAKGRFIAFCDSDDQWKKNKLEKQIAFMEQKNVALAYTAYDVIDEQNDARGEVVPPLKVTYKDMLKNNYIGCLTAIYDSGKLGKMYMPTIRKRQDWALWLAILKKIDFAQGLEEKLSIYRVRRSSLSDKKVELLKYNFRLYHEIEGYSYIKSIYFLIRFLYYYSQKNKK